VFFFFFECAKKVDKLSTAIQYMRTIGQQLESTKAARILKAVENGKRK